MALIFQTAREETKFALEGKTYGVAPSTTDGFNVNIMNHAKDFHFHRNPAVGIGKMPGSGTENMNWSPDGSPERETEKSCWQKTITVFAASLQTGPQFKINAISWMT